MIPCLFGRAARLGEDRPAEDRPVAHSASRQKVCRPRALTILAAFAEVVMVRAAQGSAGRTWHCVCTMIPMGRQAGTGLAWRLSRRSPMADQKNRGGQKQGKQQPEHSEQKQGNTTQGTAERLDQDRRA